MPNEIQKRDDARAVIEKPVLAILRKNKAVIETIAKGVLTEERVFRLINAAISRTPDLLECSPFSVLNAIVHATYLGLEVAPEQCYLIPFRSKKDGGKKICTLVVDFRGKIRIAANAGIVVDDPEIVYANDKFRRWTDEMGKHFNHEPLESGDRGAPIGAYCVTRWEGHAKITYMTAAEIGEIEAGAAARGGSESPWKTHKMRMWCKTTVHRAFKTLPRPTQQQQAERIQRSQEIDDRNDLSEGLDPIIEGDFDDDQPMLPPGSMEKQEEISEKKIAEMKSAGFGEYATVKTPPSRPISPDVPQPTKKDPLHVTEQDIPETGTTRDLTPAELRALDEQDRREAERQQPKQETKPAAGFKFGRKP